MQRLLTLASCLFAVGAVAYARSPSLSELATLPRGAFGVVVGTIALAIFVGEIARVVKLPRLVGYTLVGLVALPLHAGVLGRAGADAVSFGRLFDVPFAASALLTGLAIGLASNLTSLRQHLRIVVAHTALQTALPTLALTAAFWGLTHGFLPVGGAEIIPLAVAALLAAMASPTAVYAVNADLHAEGRFPELLLLVALARNLLIVVVIAGLAVALSIGFDVANLHALDVLEAHGPAVGLTLGGGLLAGLFLLGTLRFAADQVVIVALAMTAIAAILTPEHPVTLFVAGALAGVIAANGTAFGFHLSDALDRSSPYFISVIIVGAIMQAPLSGDGAVWAAAGVLSIIRLIAIYLAARAAGAASSLVAQGHFAYALFAQAFTALAVLGFADPRSELFALAYTYLPPLVVIDLILGSLLQRIALVRSGVAAEVVVRPAGYVVPARAAASTAPGTRLDDERSLLPPPHLPDPNYRSEHLNRVVLRLRQRAVRAQDALARGFFDERRDFVEHAIDDARDRLLSQAFETFESLRSTADLNARRELLRQRRVALDREFLELMQSFGPAVEPGRLVETIGAFVREMERACEVEVHIIAPEEDATRVADSADGAVARMRKALHVMNTRFGPRPMRTVPVRAIAQKHLVCDVPDHLEPGLHLDGRFRIFLWQRLGNVHQAIDDMFEQTLAHLDEDERSRVDRSSPLVGREDLTAAAARENEELAAFDQRLRELAGTDAPDTTSTADEPFEPLLVDAGPADQDDAVLEAWSHFVANLAVDFDDLEDDVLTFEADVRRRFALGLDAAYRGLLRDLSLGGTYALPARRIEPGDHRAALQSLAAEAGHWRALARAFTDRRAMLLAFRDLEARLRKRLDAFVGQVETELTSHLTYYPAEISERCDDVGAALRETFDAAASNADLDDAFVQIRQNLTDFLQDEALASVHEMRETNLFGEMLRAFTEDVSKLIADRRDTFSVADEAFLDRSETVSAMDFAPMEVPFGAVLERHFVQVTATFFNDLALRVQNVVDAVAAGLGQVNRVISFNLDAALAELRADGADDSNRRLIAEFAIGGIERAGEQAAELLTTVEADVEAIDRDIVEKTVEHLRAVRRYLFDESMGRLERLAFEAEHEREELQREGARGLRRLSERARTQWATLAEPAQRLADAAREHLMLDEPNREALIEDGGHAHFEAPAMQALPVAYRRLFTPAPVETPELFLARESASTRLRAALGRWEEGRRVAVLVAGDLGMGKTTFVNRVVNEMSGSARLIRWNIRERITDTDTMLGELSQACGVRKVTSAERLLAALQDVEGRRVVVVDGLGRLFLRTMDGREALQTFLGVLAQSPAHVLWLVTCNTKLWTYLQTMMHAADYFTDELLLEPLTRAETETLILHRHRVSGFALVFDGDDDQARLQRRYFDRLHAAAGQGHPLLAQYYWASSVRGDEEDDDLLHIGALRPLRTDYLRHLDDEKLIGLGQLVLHEQLTEEEYAAVMRCSPEGARRDFAFFESFGLVVREPGRRFRYGLNEVLAPDIERALRERNIL